MEGMSLKDGQGLGGWGLKKTCLPGESLQPIQEVMRAVWLAHGFPMGGYN